MAANGGVGTPAVTTAVYAALTYDVISATNSSPQTTEINAAKRAETLMKWVHLGMAQAFIFAAIGIFMEYKSKRSVLPPLLGSGLAMVMLYGQYYHARDAGLRNPGPPSEEY
jgi:hypothetical protein